MTNLEKAKNNLGEHKISIVSSTLSLTSDLRGVMPIIDFINEGYDLSGASVADLVVGKAAAMLFIKAGIKDVDTIIISKPALKVLEEHHITVKYEKLVDNIINRDKTGLCPFESLVLDVDDVSIAYKLIVEKLESFKKK